MSKWNDMLEHAIIGKLTTTLLNAGYRIDIEYLNGYMWVYAYDVEKRPFTYKHWVKCVEGNGCDIIVDYTTNLEKDLKSVNEFAEQYRD